MQSIFGIIYLLLFLGYVVAGLFIIFHIFRYSLRRGLALFGATLFLIVFTVLLFTNIRIFLLLPFDEFLTRSF